MSRAKKVARPRRAQRGPLDGLDEDALRAWLLARMRGEEEDPPIAESRLESPDDYVRLVYQETSDGGLRKRIARAIVVALKEAAGGNLRRGRDARAVRHLAALAEGARIAAAAPVLLEIAERGAFDGHEGALAEDTEVLVLFALAGLQAPGELSARWHALWERGSPRLWPVATAGLRRSDPRRALAVLPEAVQRAERHAELPLGEILWSFATDTGGVYRSGDVAGALVGLSAEARERCREALRSVGAEEEEICAPRAGAAAGGRAAHGEGAGAASRPQGLEERRDSRL